MITLDRFQNIKVFKYSKNKNKWMKIDGLMNYLIIQMHLRTVW